MKVIKNFICSSIRNKLLMITGLGTSLVIAATAYGIYIGWQVENEMSQMLKEELKLESGLLDLSSDFRNQIQEWSNVLIRGYKDEQREKHWEGFNNKHKLVQHDADLLAENVHDDEIVQKLAEFKRMHEQLLPQYQSALKKFVKSGYNHIIADLEVAGIEVAPINKLLEISELLNKNIKANIAVTELHADNAIKLTIVMLTGAVFISFIVFLVMVQRIIVGPAQSVAQDLALMADGDFSCEIIVTSLMSLVRSPPVQLHCMKI